jgi:putative glutamine amidotransferase
MSKKLIGIVGWGMGENSFGATKPYVEYLKNHGRLVILAPDEDIHPDLDLLVLPGGKDLSTHFYKQAPGMFNSDADQFKEYFFVNNLPKYIEAGIPIFGICLGFQQLCVHFGAKMKQHLVYHPTTPSDSRWECVHEVKVAPAYRYLLGEDVSGKKKDTFKSNSLHHQGVAQEDFPSTILDVVGTSDKGTVLEAIKHKTLPIYGVQYHPEEIYDNLAWNMILELLKHEKKNG